MSLSVDDRQVQRNLKRVANDSPRVMAEALNKTAFEILEAEKTHVGSIFNFEGREGTRRFLSGPGSFFFRKATAARMAVTIMPKRKTGEILSEHIDRDPLNPQQHLRFDGMLAIPIQVRRGKRGKVGKRRTPAAIVGPGGRGFRNRNVILERTSKRSRKLRIAYALVSRATNPPVFKFFDTAVRTARSVFAAKLERAMQKSLSRIRG